VQSILAVKEKAGEGVPRLVHRHGAPLVVGGAESGALLSFLVIQVWDTANAHFRPGLYQWSIEFFKYPLIAIGEIALMAAVLYHAFNGIRITLLDFKPDWWQHQRTSAYIVWGLFAIAFIPIAILMFSELIHRCTELAEAGATCWRIPPFSDYQPFSEIH
jgi:succinate dehydrogenase / fumarate reductase cytochrome b subunit